MAVKKRLLWQLYSTYLLITILSLVAVTWYASRAQRHFYLNEVAADLRARARLLEHQVLARLDPLDREGIDRLCKFVGRRSATRVTVILPSGVVAGDSEEDPAKMDTHVDRPEFVASLKGEFGMSLRFSRTLGQNMMYVGIPLRGEGGRPLAVLRTSIPVDAVDRALEEIRRKIVLGGVLIAILAALLSLWVSRRLTGPIEEMRQWARDAARGDFRPKVSGTRLEEIDALSDAMNHMAHELHDRIDTVLRQRNEIETVLSSMVEGVIAVDLEERVISMNGAAGRLFGCDPTGVKGRSIQEVVRNTDLQAFVKKALGGRGPVEREIVLTADGETYLQGHGTQLRSAEGRQIGALIVLNDVTRIRRLENIRRDFVANVSHEIKTPITAIKGFVETLREGALGSPEDAERFLEIIETHADRLEVIIEDLLSLSRIEQEVEKHKVLLSEAPVRDVLANAVRMCEIRAEAKGIVLELSCPNQLRARINATLLEQAVVNLIDNAIKYSGEGRTVRIEGSEGQSEIGIEVHDEGCGIEREHLPRLFERFYRVDKARSRKLGGTGLGLAIVKHIVQAHGGRVSVESTPGRGSTFTIHLPGA